jgi:hypothetical protein
MELFLVDNKIVATQQAYQSPFMKEAYEEIKYFYCPSCGTVWGMRVNPDAVSPRHYYYKSKCKPCGGAPDMLVTWERDNSEVLSPNVLAYLILTLTEEVKDHENRTV